MLMAMEYYTQQLAYDVRIDFAYFVRIEIAYGVRTRFAYTVCGIHSYPNPLAPSPERLPP
ncbi:hypothetical protein K701_22875 [Streptomyces fradiae ATCC 10745 = DSM 40063]|uniref:Uncharacterized protein n=3 Tax=Streptomyces fradiae TaxID=1906 RepID=A0ABQ6XPD3_STRFR|nr:hypothetical protein K701_22875 [Streptomyces fradiae ATCC 10745 = DSM 40063]